MRRLTTLLLAGLAFALVACGGSGNPYQHDQEMARRVQAG